MTYPIQHYPAAVIDVVDLGGERVTIRPILPQDAVLEQAFVRDLSSAARHNRFFGALRELPPGMLQAFTNIDYRNQFALVAEVFAGGEEVLIGDARYVADSDRTSADFALAVADRWQGRGLGGLLLERLECHAAAAGIPLLVADTLYDNRGMLALAKKNGFTIAPRSRGPGIVSIEKALAPGLDFVPCFAGRRTTDVRQRIVETRS